MAPTTMTTFPFVNSALQETAGADHDPPTAIAANARHPCQTAGSAPSGLRSIECDAREQQEREVQDDVEGN